MFETATFFSLCLVSRILQGIKFLVQLEPPTTIMPTFNSVEFVCNPSVEEHEEAVVKKDDLRYGVTHYNILFTYTTTKDHLKAMTLAHLSFKFFFYTNGNS